MRNLFVKTALVLCTTIIFLPATVFATEPQNTEITSAEEGFTDSDPSVSYENDNSLTLDEKEDDSTSTLKEKLNEIVPDAEKVQAREAAWQKEVKEKRMSVIELKASEIPTEKVDYQPVPEELPGKAGKIVESLSVDQLAPERKNSKNFLSTKKAAVFISKPAA